MATFCSWGWREKQKDISQKQSPGRVLEERCSKIFGKAYRKTRVQEPFLKNNFRMWACNFILRPEAFCKKDFLRNFTTFTEKHLCQSLLFNKVAGPKTLAHVFSCECCEISKHSFLHRTPLVVASEFLAKLKKYVKSTKVSKQLVSNGKLFQHHIR